MAQRTFTNEQLAKAWKEAADKNQTRRDVVLAIMVANGVANTDDNYRKCYNNVTQRVKLLESGTVPVVFPTLAEGKKGARRSSTETAALQAILGTPAPTEGEQVAA